MAKFCARRNWKRHLAELHPRSSLLHGTPLSELLPSPTSPTQRPASVHPRSQHLHSNQHPSVPELLTSGRLFVADHSYQLSYTKGAGKYGAATTALFFIHPVSGDFLPLAIKTNVGSDLIYTPLDEPNDWLLAKILFNENDLFHGQMYHLVASHDVAEIVHQAAVRTLSDEHPVMILLERRTFPSRSPSKILLTELFQ